VYADPAGHPFCLGWGHPSREKVAALVAKRLGPAEPSQSTSDQWTFHALAANPGASQAIYTPPVRAASHGHSGRTLAGRAVGDGAGLLNVCRCARRVSGPCEEDDLVGLDLVSIQECGEGACDSAYEATVLRESPG